MKMNLKIIAILATAVMLLSILEIAFVVPINAATPITSATVPGNLNTDTYLDYPFSPTSLTFGFSQYGEMIDPNTLVGLSYGTVDPFAPSMNVVNGLVSPPQYEWIEGWILNCTYVMDGAYANIWAMATYSDYAAGAGGIGGAWNQMVTVGSTSLAVRGGRKTSGGAQTTPITVLYDGPREYIATTTTTLYTDNTYTNPLLNVTFTFDFNTVSKDVEVIKDIKRITISKDIGSMQVQFGDRGEWDLGTGTPPTSYAYVFDDEPTVYNGNYQPWYANATGSSASYDGTYDVAQIISTSTNYTGFAAFWPTPITMWVGATQAEATRDTILTSLGTETEDQNFTGLNYGEGPVSGVYYYVTPTYTPIAYPQNTTTGSVYWQNDPMVFVNNMSMIVLDSANWPGSFNSPANQVYWDSNTDTLWFPTGYQPALGSDIRLVYEVDDSKNYMAVEPGSPFIIGEWAFMMNYGTANAFQGVTLYGVTDTHNAVYSSTPDLNVLDREVTYLLDQTFWPTDLYDAVTQDTNTWVDFTTTPVGTGTTTYDLLHTPAIYVPGAEWDQYNVQSERVEDLTNGTLLHRVANDPLLGDPPQYSVTYAIAPGGYYYLTGITLPDTGDTYKITYATYTCYSYPEITITPSFVITNTTSTLNSTLTTYGSGYLLDNYVDLLGATQTIQYEADITAWTNNTALMSGAADESVTLSGNLYDSGSQLTVFKENTLQQTIYDIGSPPINQVATNGNLSMTFSGIDADWSVKAPNLTDLGIDWFNFDVDYSMTLEFVYVNATTYYWTFTSSFIVGTESGIYKEEIPGSYNWGIVGTTAATVDSAGLSMVSAAFKDKEVEYGLAGADIFAGNSSSASNQMPYIMAETGTSATNPSWGNYYYSNFVGYATTDARVALGDDWDPTLYAYDGTLGGLAGTVMNVPITRSNVIGVGGPLANMLSYYGNDFMDAIYAEPWFAIGSPWSGNIAAVTDWGRTSYSDSSTSTSAIGYAAITTAQDINGTTMFLLYGIEGRDTYYAAQWFQEEGIYELQLAPCGMTSIILKITYENTAAGYKPTAFNVVSCLGTVSETIWTGCLWGQTFTKGGFNDP
jgi:hypothetical protein